MKSLKGIVAKEKTEVVAVNLLGHFVSRKSKEGLVKGMIVETEAYLSENDQACHASRGKTRRNETMFDSAGKAYVYFIYGNYYCFNVVTGPAGRGEAVLIRAVEPVAGLELMRKRRGCPDHDQDLTNGPGKLCQAFAIDGSLNGHMLWQEPLYLEENNKMNDEMQMIATPRIGISRATEKKLRFIISGSDYLSRRESFEQCNNR
ncbi:MAG: DNA-3-methyladenine glycosylase [Bacillota bacterium]